MKIKIFSSVPQGACSFYRSAPVIMLNQLDDTINASYAEKIDWNFMVGVDCVFFERTESQDIFRALEKIKAMHIPIWSDYDDDLFNLPDDNLAYEHYSKKEIKESIIGCIGISDVVTVTTESLKQKFLQFNPNIVVIPNSFNDYNYRLDKTVGENRIINWRGSTTHRRDILTVANAMTQISREKQDWVFSFIGSNMEFITDKLVNVKQINEMPVSTYFEFLDQLSLAIQIVPLQFHTFNHSKSNIAFIEGVQTGACCLAPNMPEWNLPGILTYNDEEEFYWQLRQLIEFPKLRKKMFKASQKYIRENLMLSEVNKKRLEILKNLVNTK